MLSFSKTVLIVKIIIAVLFSAFLFYRLYLSHPGRKAILYRQKPLRSFFLIILAVTGIFVFFNLGKLRGERQGFIHYGEMYHYYFGTKYFRELGYFDLYNATVVADADMDNTLSRMSNFQNLDDYSLQTRESVLTRADQYKGKFSPKRWQQFKADLKYFILRCNMIADNYFARLLLDHGYNGTPVFTIFTSLLTNLVPVNNLTLLSLIDILLLVLMFIVIGRSFDFEVAIAAVIFFSINILNDYGYVMGSVLRYDWLVCLIIAACWLAKQKYLPAGILLAYAVLVRIFPVIFLCGPGIAALWAIINQKKIPPKYLQLAGGFGGATLVLLALTLINPQPFKTWQTFFANMQLHSTKVSINFVGLPSLIVADTSYFDDSRFQQTYRDPRQGLIANWQAVKQETFQNRKILYYSLCLLILAALVLLIRKRSLKDPEALTWGIILIFALLMVSHYYYMFLLLWFIMFYRREVNLYNTMYLLALTGLQIVFYFLDLTYGGNIPLFTLVSLLLLLYFVGVGVSEFLRPVPAVVVKPIVPPRKRRRRKR